MAKAPLMQCGHTAQARNTATGDWVCVICFGSPEATTPIDNTPELSGRKARCSYYGSIPRGRNHEGPPGCNRGERCLCEKPSAPELPFFRHTPEEEFDSFYCGCWGWD